MAINFDFESPPPNASDNRTEELIKAVFSTPEGKELVKRWHDEIILRPTIVEDPSLYSLGYAEGIKSVVCGIIHATHRED